MALYMRGLPLGEPGGSSEQEGMKDLDIAAGFCGRKCEGGSRFGSAGNPNAPN